MYQPYLLMFFIDFFIRELRCHRETDRMDPARAAYSHSASVGKRQVNPEGGGNFLFINLQNFVACVQFT